jgi:hypothetical protein
MIAVIHKEMFIELLRAMAEATEFGIISTAIANTPGDVEFSLSHDAFH